LGVRKKFTKTSTPGNVFIPHKERRGTDIDPKKIFSPDLKEKAISENGIGRNTIERYSEGANNPHLGLTKAPPIMTPLNHKGPAQMVKVELSEILPYQEVKDEATLRREKLVNELNEGFDKAINRYDKFIINPQKEIVMNAVIDSQIDNKAINAADVLVKLNEFGQKMSDESAEAYLHYNPDRGAALAAERSIRRKRELATYGHYLPEEDHDILDPGKQDSISMDTKVTEANSISIEDLLSDDTPTTINTTNKVETQQKQEPDSYAIDPSMLL